MKTLRDIQTDRRDGKKKFLPFIAALFIICVALYSFSRLADKAPEISNDAINIGVVKQGSIIRDVRAPGRLEPNIQLWVAANVDARVDRKLLEPGAEVNKDSVILTLSAPELIQQYKTAEIESRVARAELNSARDQAESDLFEQHAKVASVEAEKKQALFVTEAKRKLFEISVIPHYQFKETELNAELVTRKLEIEKQRLRSLPKLQESLLSVKEAKLAQAQLKLSLLEEMVDRLQVRAGINGILQELSVEEGQQISKGTALARVASQNNLKAVLNVQENQTKDIDVGQKVTIDTRLTKIQGIVSRIDPAVTNGTVAVDVRIQSELPREARPDLRVEGTIEIERLDNIVYINKPAKWNATKQAYLFKLEDDRAIKSKVFYGINSVSSVQLTSGLAPGDRVILSDMTELMDYNEVTIN